LLTPLPAEGFLNLFKRNWLEYHNLINRFQVELGLPSMSTIALVPGSGPQSCG
jgi:hypothetical protein